MAPYHVGIDFGTSQTKICIKNLTRNNYFFHKFNSNSLYFLPSTIQVNSAGFCLIGSEGVNQIRFFKMAALHDEEFDRLFSDNHISSKLEYLKNRAEANRIPTTQEDLTRFPELCCVIYLSAIIIQIRESLQQVEEISIQDKQPEIARKLAEESTPAEKQATTLDKLLSIFKKKSSVQENDTPVEIENELRSTKEVRILNPTLLLTIGIPTEFDNNYNVLRRRKMYQLLLIANKVSKEIESTNKFKSTPLPELVQLIRKIFEETIKSKSVPALEEVYNKEGLYVIAETTAGIEPVRNDRKRMLFEIINQNSDNWQQEYFNFKQNHAGCYMIMDIGAGTTDISYFQMITFSNGEIKVKYYSSQPIPYASNQIISNFLKTKDFDEIAKFDYSLSASQDWKKCQQKCRKELYRIINGYDSSKPEKSVFGRVRSIFRRNRLSIYKHWNYQDPPPFVIAKGCLVYGGGSRFKEFGSGHLTLDHGGGNSMTITEIKKLIQGNEILNNLNLTNKEGFPLEQYDQAELADSLDMLIVALGLAMLSPGNRGDGWLNADDYLPDSTPVNIDPNKPIFDLFKRRWV